MTEVHTQQTIQAKLLPRLDQKKKRARAKASDVCTKLAEFENAVLRVGDVRPQCCVPFVFVKISAHWNNTGQAYCIWVTVFQKLCFPCPLKHKICIFRLIHSKKLSPKALFLSERNRLCVDGGPKTRIFVLVVPLCFLFWKKCREICFIYFMAES